ncbi:MAG: polyphosphate:AMP phosphotransferase [Pseudomonadota bacterium]
MFESLRLDHTLNKADFKAEEPDLRNRLIEAQLDLLEKPDFPVIVLLSGMDPIGRSQATKQLLNWLDSRHVRLFASIRKSDEESARPRLWRFWRALPPKGEIGIFLNSWYETPIRDHFLGETGADRFREQIDEIRRFEEMLCHEGALFLKFMLFVPREKAAAEIKALGKKGRQPWKVSKEEREIGQAYVERYGHARAVTERMISETSTGYAPWYPLASADPHYRDLTIGRTLAAAIRTRLEEPARPVPTGGAGLESPPAPNLLDALNLNRTLDKKTYSKRLEAEQTQLTKLTLGRKFEKRGLVAVFEGNDAAGKGGSIRRVVQALDPRMLDVVSIAAPSDEEKAQPYLWRFWRHVPARGGITIFDRSWYGRVLVERVEGFATQSDWMRAYEEIRTFEAELTEYGIIVVKFWLAIDQQEQLRRFKEREDVEYKRHKITEEDWRNRDKWDAYRDAVHEMVDRTSTRQAPWTLVEANDKRFARVKVISTLNDRLKALL